MRRTAAAALLAATASAAAGCGAQDYDVVVRSGRIVDGTGAAPYAADIGIRGDRITAVGDLSNAHAAVVVDAAGLHVAPGFIDLHSHAAGGLASPERSPALALLAQGITTAVINPDGGGAADLVRQREDLLRDGLGVNVVQLVPHGAVRSRAMGGSFDRAPTAEELEEMRRLVRAGMEAGAFGMSTGLFYTPGSYAEQAEIVALARIVAEYGGIHSSHIRDEADYDVGVVAAVQEIIDISRASGVTGIVSHIKALGPNVWGASREIVARIEAARSEGVDVWADQYPYDASATGLTAALVPAWARAGDEGGLRGRLGDPEPAARIRAAMVENLARRGGAERIMFRGDDPLAGRTLAEVAERRGLAPVDAAIALIRDGQAGGIISFNMNEDDIVRLMRQDWTLTSSDGDLPVFGRGTTHPRAYGAFARKLREYVVQRGVIDLPFAVRSMAGASAGVLRLEDRGVIREGAYADIVVFDLERVDDPADFLEPHQYARGMVHVLVNGQFTIRDGEFTDALPGRVLLRRE